VIRLSHGVIRLSRAVIRLSRAVIRLSRAVIRLSRAVIRVSRAVIRLSRAVIRLSRVLFRPVHGIEYTPPFGILGRNIDPIAIKPRLRKLFAFRHRVTREYCENA
jgi:hypothetical protein